MLAGRTQEIIQMSQNPLPDEISVIIKGILIFG
jgi:hypothetical protein